MSIPAFQKDVTIRSTTSSTNHTLPATSATLTLAGDLLDDTDITSTGFRSKIIGLRDYNVAVPSNYDTSNTAITVARNAWLNQTRVFFQYLPDGTKGFSGVAHVETFSLSGEVSGLETVEISLQADSALSTV